MAGKMEVTCLISPPPPQLPCPQQMQVNCTGKLQGQCHSWLRYEDYLLNPSPLHIAPTNRHRWTGEARDWPACSGGSQGSSTGREDGGHLFNRPPPPPPPTHTHTLSHLPTDTGEQVKWGTDLPVQVAARAAALAGKIEVTCLIPPTHFPTPTHQ